MFVFLFFYYMFQFYGNDLAAIIGEAGGYGSGCGMTNGDSEEG